MEITRMLDIPRAIFEIFSAQYGAGAKDEILIHPSDPVSSGQPARIRFLQTLQSQRYPDWAPALVLKSSNHSSEEHSAVYLMPTVSKPPTEDDLEHMPLHMVCRIYANEELKPTHHRDRLRRVCAGQHGFDRGLYLTKDDLLAPIALEMFLRARELAAPFPTEVPYTEAVLA